MIDIDPTAGAPVIIAGIPATKAHQVICGIAEYTPALETKKMACHCCGHPVWVGARQQEKLAKEQGKAQVWCPLCLVEYGLLTPGTPIKSLGGRSGAYVFTKNT